MTLVELLVVIAVLAERYGLEAVMVESNFIPHRAGIWVCPSQEDSMRTFGNTYAFSVAQVLSVKNPENLSRVMWVWDNFSLRPGLSGFRGPFSGYTINQRDRVYPHGTLRGRGYNALYLDGHVKYREI